MGAVLLAQTDSVRTLHTISVIPVRDSVSRISVIKSSVPYYRLDENKLMDLGIRDVGDAIKYVPGVQLKDYGGIGGIKTVSFRSLGANHTGVLYDGNLVLDAQTGTINLSVLDMLGMRSVSFTTGQPAADAAPASAYLPANVVSADTWMMSRPERFVVNGYSRLSSINAYENGLMIRLPVKKMHVAGSAIIRNGNGQYKYAFPQLGTSDLQLRQHTEMLAYRLRGLVGIPLRKGRISLQVQYRNSQQQLPGAVVLYNPYNDQELWNKSTQVIANEVLASGKWQFRTHAFYQQDFTRYKDPYFLNQKGFIDSKYMQQNGVVGFMLRRKMQQEGQVFFGADGIISMLGGNDIPASPIRKRINGVVGVKRQFAEDHLILEGNLALQLVNDQNKMDATTTRNYVKPSPFIALAYLPFKNTALRFRTFYKRTFRLPSFNDRYYNFLGDNHVRPEEANLFNVGVTYGKKLGFLLLELSADGYFNQVWDKIIAVPTKDLFNWSVQNIGRTNSTGTDIGLLISASVCKVIITVSSNHNFNRTIDVTNPFGPTYRDQIPYTPHYSSSHSLTLKWKGFGLNTNLFYNGFRYSLNENIYANYLPAFTDWNVGLSGEFDLKKNRMLNMDLKVMNLLNNNYQVIRSYPMPGRYYQLMLKFRI